MRSFQLSIPDDVVADLRARLARTRLLPDSPRRPPSGLSSEHLRALVDSWAELDWSARERELNEHPQFIADVGGTDIHFVHLRSARPDAPALLVMHGWPHTFALQLEFARLLPDFHVILPSMPGFAFSAPYDGTMTEAVMANLMHTLMTEVLGYSRYLTYGEDISANVSDLIAASHPEAVQGILATHAHFGTDFERDALEDPEARAFFARLSARGGPDGAYAHIQATRPDTLAAGVNDSPAGLLAWLVEKLIEWSDTPAGDPEFVERRISRDRILTEATIYWATQSIATSFRPYFDGGEDVPIPPVEVPAAVAIQRHEHDYPESLARAYYRDLRSFERMPEGGHFTVAEVPAAMADRMRSFARELRLLPA
ncbi:epoxide hydrolase family protein [Microbacterium sp. SD291]|uniref:epoxide hydrolase family protein n=1 Tax=Microbacterium sp. SD291 TaxID=2782007 RepID=UPI001A97B456|nr:epoxide hydrolase [Microbacterium sp. SD291]MBO0979853.1 epoxide hydrolase [Microbacterium sp. SD291]